MIESRYKPEYCEMLVEHMSKGYSFGSFGADVNAGMELLTLWKREHDEFNKAFKLGQEKSKKFWETLHLMKASGQKTAKIDPKQMDTTAIIFGLKTRFRDVYGETVTVEMRPTEIAEELTAFQVKSLHSLLGERIIELEPKDVKEVQKEPKEDE